MVIEAATEKEEVKRKIFTALCPSLKPETIVGTNTSSISITRLAAATDRPERFIGIHFMNPVPLMELVDHPRYRHRRRDLRDDQAVHQQSRQANRESEDFPAFIVNRILLPMINEAIYTLYEGVGNVEAIDTAMRLGAHHPMGPLELADFIGLDTCLSVMQVLHEGLADSKYRPCPLLVKYVEAGWLGRKTQRGFYDYRGEKPVPDAINCSRLDRAIARPVHDFHNNGCPACSERSVAALLSATAGHNDVAVYWISPQNRPTMQTKPSTKISVRM